MKHLKKFEDNYLYDKYISGGGVKGEDILLSKIVVDKESKLYKGHFIIEGTANTLPTSIFVNKKKITPSYGSNSKIFIYEVYERVQNLTINSDSNILSITKFNPGVHMETMNSMFSNCYALKEVDLSNVQAKRVTNKASMFNHCNSLTTVDFKKMNTSNVTTMNSMFTDCYGLKMTHLGNIDTSSLTDTTMMFNSCMNMIYFFFQLFV